MSPFPCGLFYFLNWILYFKYPIQKKEITSVNKNCCNSGIHFVIPLPLKYAGKYRGYLRNEENKVNLSDRSEVVESFMQISSGPSLSGSKSISNCPEELAQDLCTLMPSKTIL